MSDEDAQYRISQIESINNMIFELVYYGHFNYLDCENMTSVELKYFHKKLLEIKNAEKEAHKKALEGIHHND